jgi:hypothetical protein
MSAAKRKSARLPVEPCVDFRHPVRTYRTVRLDNWRLRIEKQLLTDAPATAERAQRRLQRMLKRALRVLPEACRPRLSKLPIYLLYGPLAQGGGRDNGGEYFQKDAPLHHLHLDRRWCHCVVLYCAENYVRLSNFWALKVLVHEFAHAYHLGQWPQEQPEILQAWQYAMKRRLYRRVKDDEGNSIARAYATVNQLEYFAELSCMYFIGCNYQPFNRKELKAYDPTGYALIEQMWQVGRRPAGLPPKRKTNTRRS